MAVLAQSTMSLASIKTVKEAADAAESLAEQAQISANNASEYAARALGNLSTVQSVAETLTWITQHGTMTITSDVALDPSHVYFVRDNNGDYQVGNYRYSVVSDPDINDISTYYELSIDESLNNYVGTHLAVDGEGLWLIPETANGNRVLIATGSGTSYPSAGTYIIGQDGSIEASFTESGVMLGQSTTAHLDVDYQSMEFIDRDGNSFLSIKDMRDKDGYITEDFYGDGTQTTFTCYCRAETIAEVRVDGDVITAYTHAGTDRDVVIHPAPANGEKVSIKYMPPEWETNASVMKTYTIGTRGDGIAGPYSIVVGHECIADFGRSYAEGWKTIAHGDGSHAEGQFTLALHMAHSEGANTKAYASGSHAEGTGAEAIGDSSHAEGWYSIAGGAASHAQGRDTIATGDCQTAIGRFNEEDVNDEFALIIGNGADTNNRSNALTVDWSGNVEASGDITDGSSNSLSQLNTDLGTLTTTVNQHTTKLDAIGTTYSDSRTAAITTAGINTYAEGARITLPANGVYVVCGYWAFNSVSSARVVDLDITDTSGTAAASSPFARQRVACNVGNWVRLEASAIVTPTTDTTVYVKGSATVTSTAQRVGIRAVRIA